MLYQFNLERVENTTEKINFKNFPVKKSIKKSNDNKSIDWLEWIKITENIHYSDDKNKVNRQTERAKRVVTDAIGHEAI